jgi:tetratricopeptide (TPR) repeat protein
MRYIISLLIILSIQSTSAQHVDKAIDAYNKADYPTAIMLWEKELKTRNCNKEQAYCLLGNAYFKNKKFAHAIANYEKSLRENYNQEDVKFNIKVVRAKLGLDTENKILFTNDYLRKVSFLLSGFILKLLIIILSCLLLAYNIYQFFKGDLKFGFLKNYLFAFTLVLLCLYFLQEKFRQEKGFAIISIESTGYENMNLKGESKALRVGEMVKVLDEIGVTIQIETEANKHYWIQKSNVIYI